MGDLRVPSDEELTIRTARLVLRPVRVEDTILLFPHCSDPRLPRQMTWAPHRDPSETKAFLTETVAARARDRDYVWSIFEEGQFRGLVGIEGVTRSFGAVRFDRGELGYWVGIPFHGRGIATEAATAATACAFARLALHKVIVRALSANAASLKVIRKLGFTEIGIARADVWREGAWHDHTAFEMLAEDPAARRIVGAVTLPRERARRTTRPKR